MSAPIPPPTEEWTEDTRKKIRDMFEIFDKDKSESVIEEEVSTIMRALGVYPSEKALVQEILTEMQDDEPSGYVHYAKFEKVMVRLMHSKEWEPDSGDMLLQAFRTVDTENTGFIVPEVMEDLLVGKGTPFRPKELENFFAAAKDPETGNIYYEDYIALISKKYVY
jgi:Ca2+-binding EF-hand superfamily protein